MSTTDSFDEMYTLSDKNWSGSSYANSPNKASREENSASDGETFYPFATDCDIITKFNLNRFVHNIDAAAEFDDQASVMIGKLANVFVQDITKSVVKLAKFRKQKPGLIDVKFALKQEYNINLPIKKN